jgi:hypothetical protein
MGEVISITPESAVNVHNDGALGVALGESQFAKLARIRAIGNEQVSRWRSEAKQVFWHE